VVKKFKASFPLGFNVESASFGGGWGDKGVEAYCCCSWWWVSFIHHQYLFNSLKQPLIILLLIPIST
jgi:hypothetical protein